MIANGFDFPDDLLLLIEHQVWARPVAPDEAVVGITSLGLHLAGELYMCRLKPAGTTLAQGRGIGVVEVAKAIVSIKSAVSGELLECNEEVQQRPDLITEDPYGRGWLARVRWRASERAQDMSQLVTASAAHDAIAAYAATAERPIR